MTSERQNAPPERLKWDAALVAVTIILLLQVWGVAYVFPILAVRGLLSIVTFVTIFLLALDRDPSRRLSSLNRPVVRAALGLLLLAALSIPGSLDPEGSFETVFQDDLRAVLLMLLVAGTVRGVADLRRLAWVQVAALTVFCAVVTARFWTGINDKRWSQVQYDVNDIAVLIASVLPLVLYLWRRPSGVWARSLLTAAAVFLMLTLGRTGSRSGFLALLTVAAYLLLWFRGVSGAKRAAAVALVAILLVTLASSDYFGRIQAILHPSTDYNWSGRSTTGRVELWKRGIGYMLSHPGLGVGAGAFQVAEGTLAPEARVQQYGQWWKWSVAHNSLLEVGAEIGVPGLIVYVVLVVCAFRALSRVRQEASGEGALLAQALIGSLIGFEVGAMFFSKAFAPYFYALLGMVVGLAKIASSVHASASPAGRVLHRSVRAPNRGTLTA